jgi:Mn2+/Fe2+ NRAMP family transporter
MKWFSRFKYLGPGIVIAATGVGAGDLITASVGGARFSTIILWSAVLGAVLKYILNEGIARWQMGSNESMIEAWVSRFPKWISWYFLMFLFLWTFIVGAALSSASGMAAHAIFPFLTLKTWAIIHAVFAFILVRFINYQAFENIMKALIAIMFAIVFYTALQTHPDWNSIIRGLIIPKIPKGSIRIILGIIGGVGGSLTLLSYGYWIKEKGWYSHKDFKTVKTDLGVAYFLTGLFGVAMMVISSELKAEVMTGNQMVLSLADQIAKSSGETGKWIFLLGFWGAVFSSMLGVWQGVPYLFSDYMNARQTQKTLTTKTLASLNKDSWYLYFQVYLVFAPLILLFFQKPIWIIISYAVIGSLFMPFLAASLIYLNHFKNKVFQNHWLINLFLILSLILFIVLLGSKLLQFF